MFPLVDVNVAQTVRNNFEQETCFLVLQTFTSLVFMLVVKIIFKAFKLHIDFLMFLSLTYEDPPTSILSREKTNKNSVKIG